MLTAKELLNNSETYSLQNIKSLFFYTYKLTQPTYI
uniref:Uncharacterized protein n=1 Tax=Anguilla anguilla TaxID=7936 RepID=A0A0E9UQ00_ANGAN